jgi:tRNA uridine 5-carboxymethylaminomethyl modification enzyme
MHLERESSTWNMFEFPRHFDVIVVGGGHAGVEAAMAASRLGAQTLMLSQNLDSIGQMSCNPAVGGLGKGHIVREIDALGGFMGINTDATAIQCRMLNTNRGPSVQAPRAQCDKKAYQFRAKAECEATENLTLYQANVVELLVEKGAVVGVTTSLGVQFRARAVVVTTGTFMGGLLHVGLQNQAGGRMGDAASTLSKSLVEHGFEVARFKTGTPCRINGKTIDFDACERQQGDDPPPMFTFHPESLSRREQDLFSLNWYDSGVFHVEQQDCFITHTTPATHEIIRANLDKSPMYCGRIQGVGPRYCPSIEDKVVRFAEKEQHQLFLEPEGRHTSEYYVNGISTSLPIEVQMAFVATIPGLENATIIRAGYAVEYDFCPPTQLYPTLETKRIQHLYFAGQINGTSGYEEAAGQGLIAGANAALKLRGSPPFVPARSDSYIGVMIDDLTTKGTTEPYRMFTSRAEYRLLLRQDNADLRLSPAAIACGLLSGSRAASFDRKAKEIAAAREFTRQTRHQSVALEQWLRRPENTAATLPEGFQQLFSEAAWRSVEIDAKYSGYIRRQQDAIERFTAAESVRLPPDLDYAAIPNLCVEARQKLSQIRPATLGQASRVSGVTPADVALLSVWVKT